MVQNHLQGAAAIQMTDVTADNPPPAAGRMERMLKAESRMNRAIEVGPRRETEMTAVTETGRITDTGPTMLAHQSARSVVETGEPPETGRAGPLIAARMGDRIIGPIGPEIAVMIVPSPAGRSPPTDGMMAETPEIGEDPRTAGLRPTNATRTAGPAGSRATGIGIAQRLARGRFASGIR